MQTSLCEGCNLLPLCALEDLFQAGSISGWNAAFFYVSGGIFLTVSFGATLQNVSVDECTLKFTLMNKWTVISVADLI